MPYPESGNFYGLLGVAINATQAEIRSAFLRLAQEHHPDLNAGDPRADRRFKQIRRVYEVLSDPVKRASYDDNPRGFRLTDADIVWNERAPIVTRPVKSSTGSWSDRVQRRTSNVYRPRWLHEAQYGDENRTVAACVIASMFALSLMPIMLVHLHHRGSSTRATISATTERPVSSAVNHTLPANNNDSTAFEQVMDSVSHLRARSETDATNEQEANPKQGEPASESALPTLDVIDEFDVPYPGWPVLSSPLPSDAVSPAASPKAKVSFEEALTPSLIAISPGAEWVSPDQLTRQLAQRPSPAFDPRVDNMRQSLPVLPLPNPEVTARSSAAFPPLPPATGLRTSTWASGDADRPAPATGQLPPFPSVAPIVAATNRMHDALQASIPALERMTQVLKPRAALPLPASLPTMRTSETYTLPTGATVVRDSYVPPNGTYATGIRSSYPAVSGQRAVSEPYDWSTPSGSLAQDHSPSFASPRSHGLSTQPSQGGLPQSSFAAPRRGF